MPDTLSANLNLLEMATGSASGAWGADLNTGVVAIVDAALGSQQAVALSSTDVTLTMTQRQNLSFALSGTLTTSVNIFLPLQTNSTTVAVGGAFIFENNCTGSFPVTVKTLAPGSTGVDVPQGVSTEVFSDTINVLYADDAQNRAITSNGNPNGVLAGTAGSAATRASRVIDRTTNQEYLCTTTGTSGSAVWSVNMPFPFSTQAYLTPSSSMLNPVVNTDTLGATTMYVTARKGGVVLVNNGLSFVPSLIPNGQLQLLLSSSSQASNGVYDVLYFLQNGNSTATVAFSPAWQTASAGSGNRGTGAGTPQLTTINGIPVNAVQQTVNNGATTYTVAANRGTYLGSVWIDSTAGQTSFNVSAGQNRKWGAWNYWEREKIVLQVQDPTASWSYQINSTIPRPSNNNPNNMGSVFQGLPEESAKMVFNQSGSGFNAGFPYIGIAQNNTSLMTGAQFYSASGSNVVPVGAILEVAPSLGRNDFYCMEKNSNPGSAIIMSGGVNMLMTIEYEG